MTPEPERRQVHLWITGRVQGVWFRESARREADRLGLIGWVRNLVDGRVEAVAEGPLAALEAFVLWCHRGPAAARVDDVKREDGPPEGLPPRFEVKR